MKLQKNKTYILDGAMGTELQRRGVKTYMPLWSTHAFFDAHDTIKQIHKDYILAGANIITTNTFRTQKRTLAKINAHGNVETINELAIDLAVAAIKETKEEADIDREIYIAASITTLEDCYRPGDVPHEKLLQKEHQEQIDLVKDLEIDFFLLETFNTIKEVEIAAEIAAKTGKPIAISFVVNNEINLLSGESLAEAVKVAEKFKPLFISVNCVPLDIADRAFEILKNSTKFPLGIYANGEGYAGTELGWKFEGNDISNEYFEHAKKWKKLGAQVIGGCCGTSPEYTKKYSKLR